MSQYEQKWRCDECNWVGPDRELLRATSPFDPERTLVGCPECKGAGGFDEICDEPGCFLVAGCGFPTPEGYRRTCYDHSVFKVEPRRKTNKRTASNKDPQRIEVPK